MLGDKDGVYTESNESVWPSNLKYHYNAERSGCIDSNGNELVNVLNYDSINNAVNLSVNSTAYCYLYFDLDGVAPQSFEFYLGGQSNPDYTNNPLVDVYINYGDNDISHYCVTEENSSNNCNWIETNSSPINTSYTLSSGDGLKTVYAYTKDLADNISEQVIDTINLDTEKPTGNTISINSNATYTQSTGVTLTLSSSGATEMCISNTNSCTSWEPYATSKSWALTNNDGNKTVYVWYKDLAGNISDSANDSITLDSAAPSNNSVSINNNDAYTTGISVTLTLKSTGATKMCISNSSTCSSYVDYVTSYSWTLSSGLGSKTVYVYFKDDAGNVSSVVTDTINLYSAISTVPSQSGTLTYSGNAQSPSWSNYDSNKLTLGGTTSGTNAGTYSATFTPKTNYIWSDGTSTAKSVNWSIAKAKISTVPSQSGSLTYTGNGQSPKWSNYSSTQLTLGGTTTGTNATTYTATFTPKANYTWNDGSTTAKNVNWSIAKASGSLSLSSSNLTVGIDRNEISNIIRSGDGKISASSSNTSVATVSVSGTTITINGVASGTATITVQVAEGTNHTAPNNKSIKIKVIHLLGDYIKNTLNPNGLNSVMNGGLYRFQGSNSTGFVNNYICFGVSDKSTCAENSDVYMYRIIGINSKGQLKVIKDTSIGSYPWHSNHTTDILWADSTLFNGINSDYYLTNDSLVPTSWAEKIFTSTWKYGAMYDGINFTADEIYSIENGWTKTVDAKIGLIYVHDYYYAATKGGTNCSNEGATISTCRVSWMRNDRDWLMSRNSGGKYFYLYSINSYGEVSTIYGSSYSLNVRPTFYLTNDVQYLGGTGTQADPILIS